MPLKKKRCQDWKLYVITDREAVGKRPLEEVVRSAVQAGASVIQLRDKLASDDELVQLARTLLKITDPLKIPLIINDRVGVAKRSGAQGVHLGQADGGLKEARQVLGPNAIFGRSTHNPEQALRAQEEGFDYIGVGPVFKTPTKPTYEPTGLGFVLFSSENIKIPFVAIGGINLENIEQVRRAGARSVAVVRAVMGSQYPARATRQLIKKLRGKHD